jgi:hypothetical protein
VESDWSDIIMGGIFVPITRKALKHLYEMGEWTQALMDRHGKGCNGKICEMYFHDRLEEGLTRIINGTMMIQKEFPDPDHPESSCKQVTVIFETNLRIPAAVQSRIVKRYAQAGWTLEFGEDWRSCGPWVICRYLESDDKRKENIIERVQGLGHEMSSWEKKDHGCYCRCVKPGCELEIFFRKNQPVDQWTHWCKGSPVQKALKCPCTQDDTC